jgi:phosphoribosylformylglycinamidine cyclo-ligase
MSEPERAYDSSQPYLDRINEATAQTRVTSDFLEFFPDGSFRNRFDFRKRESTDGVGTKGGHHWRHRTFEAAAQDAVAMVLNDLYRDRALPYKFSNAILVEQQDEEAITRTVTALASLAAERHIGIPSGETAIHARSAAGKRIDGMDIVIVGSGAVVDTAPNQYRPGDILIGLPSSGLHSNGFTTAELLLGSELLPELLAPTRIYDEVSYLHHAVEVHGMTHVTGDGFNKLKLNGAELEFVIDGLPHGSTNVLFQELYSRWSDRNPDQADREMYLTFNNGIGFIIGVPPEQATEALRQLEAQRPNGGARLIGMVKESGADPGISIQSQYTDRTVHL